MACLLEHQITYTKNKITSDRKHPFIQSQEVLKCHDLLRPGRRKEKK